MKINYTILLLLLTTFSYCQKMTILAKVISSSDNYSLGFSTVHIDNKCATTCDSTGEFILTCDKAFLKDTLRVKFIGHRPLNIINLPTNRDTLDLGILPMFLIDDDMGAVSMVDFFCHWYNFKCRHKAKLFWKNEMEKKQEQINKINSLIDSYVFHLNGKTYKLKAKGEIYYKLYVLLDLSNPIEN